MPNRHTSEANRASIVFDWFTRRVGGGFAFAITFQGIIICGLKVLLSVYTKEKGRPGREGLVWEVYNQETCATCILHLSANSLLEQVSIVGSLVAQGVDMLRTFRYVRDVFRIVETSLYCTRVP